MRGFRVLVILPTILESVGNMSDEVGDKEGKELLAQLDGTKRDAAWVQTEAESEFPLLHAHSVVGLWSALEVLCEDFAITWLKNVPSAWSLPEVAKIKIPLSTYQQLSEDEKLRHVVSEISRSQGSEMRKGVGKLKALLQVFALSPAIGPNAQKALHELCQVRNVFVHCGGVADQKFKAECPWFNISPGQQVRINHGLYGWYYSAAKRYARRVSNQALVALGFPGCECPGLDEIKSRPSGSKTLGWGMPR
jgi:hypothetical protein